MSNKLKVMDVEEDFGWDYYDEEGFKNYQKRALSYCQTPQQMAKEYQSTSNQKASPPLYRGLILEEMSEWNNEVCKVDYSPGAELKELADTVYVIYGYAESKGFDLDEALRRVHSNNMARMYQDDGTIHYREDGKVKKNLNTPKVYLGDLT